MFSPVQIKQEYPAVDEGNQNITNGVPAPSEYPIFTNQDVEYMYRQLPQFWGQAQLQTNQMVEDLASKGETHQRPDIAHNQPPVQHLAVANYLQQQSQSPHVMPFQVEQQQQQQHSHEQDSQRQGQLSQQQQQQQPPQQSQASQQSSITHTSQDGHQPQLLMQHPVSLNPALLVQTQITTVPTTKHNGPGRPPKSGTTGSQTSPPKKMKCQCEICFKEFGHKSNLFIHMRTHNGERPYKCSQCDKCFTHSGNLAIHMRTHSGERPYACQICGKMFSHSGNLSTHLRTHSGVKPYKCSVCGKEFRHSGNLSIHERIHSGIKPFQCKVCGKEFYHSGNLTTHMKKHPIPKSLIEQAQHCADGSETRIETRIVETIEVTTNPVRLAVNVAPSLPANRPDVAVVGNNEDRESVKSEGREDKRGDETLQFAPPTS